MSKHHWYGVCTIALVAALVIGVVVELSSAQESQAALSIDDEFNDSASLSNWTMLYQGSALIGVNGTTPGQLTIIPSVQGVWFNDGVAPFMYKTISCDFVMSAHVNARSVNNPLVGPARQYNAAGILVRNPASAPN